MATNYGEFLLKPLTRFFTNTFSQIAEINRKYSKPQIKTSPAVKISLLLLRLYLILLVGILFFKFYTTVVQ